MQALIAGNAVVLKPSEVTPDLGPARRGALRAPRACPTGVLQSGAGRRRDRARRCVDAGVDKISFTGSVATGRRVAEACGRQLIPCTLELGGKDPMIVCADADLERAARGAVYGAFCNAGQVCTSTERVYVVDAWPTSSRAAWSSRPASCARAPTASSTSAPMIWAEQLEIVEDHVARRGREGRARAGRRAAQSERTAGLFFEPTVLDDVTHDMEIMREETFGPVLPIMRVRDEDEALAYANDSPLRPQRERLDARPAPRRRARQGDRVRLRGRQRLHDHLRRPRVAVRRREGERHRARERRAGPARHAATRSRS